MKQQNFVLCEPVPPNFVHGLKEK